MTEPPSLPFATRLWFCFACWLRVLFDPLFAARVWAVQGGAVPPLLSTEPPSQQPLPLASAPPPAPTVSIVTAIPSETPALQLLALLQREGRLIDFVQEEIAAFSDEQVGAAARVVHEGCRQALQEHVALEPIRTETEGATITLPATFDAAAVRLIGNVSGHGPYRGTLRHRGWRARGIHLPVLIEGNEADILAPAEVEL